MNSLAILFVAQTFSAAPLRVGEPVATADGVEIPVDGTLTALGHTERHVLTDRIVLFVPGATATARATKLADGPLSAIRVTPADLGVAVTLLTRGPAAQVAERLELATAERPSFRLRTGVDAPRAIEPVESHATPATAIALPQASARQSAPLQSLGLAAPHESPAPTFALVGFVVLALAGIAWWLRRARVKEQPGSSIQVLAVRAIGPKQKLMMVDTGGERFLLATSDKEIHLLSALGTEALEEPLTKIEPELAPRDLELAEPLEAEPAEPGPSDLAGLIRLTGGRAPGRRVAA